MKIYPETEAVEINNEIGCYPPLIDENGKYLLGWWIGTVEVVIDAVKDEFNYGYYDYISENFLAYKLVSGEIVFTEAEWIKNPIKPVKVHSLKGAMHIISWGVYPFKFPENWKYLVPKALPVTERQSYDELPC